jgi:predicted metal-binding membrane protein
MGGTGWLGGAGAGLGFAGAWAVMMAAMMLPSLVPAVRAYPGSGTPGFVAGYLLLWSAVGVPAYLLDQALRSATMWVGAGALLLAGVYQATPVQYACLRRCRESAAAAGVGAVARGLRYGLACVGASWPLMVLLLLLGAMNLGWMALAGALVLVQKVAPWPRLAALLVAAALVGLGLVLVLR